MLIEERLERLQLWCELEKKNIGRLHAGSLLVQDIEDTIAEVRKLRKVEQAAQKAVNMYRSEKVPNPYLASIGGHCIEKALQELRDA